MTAQLDLQAHNCPAPCPVCHGVQAVAAKLPSKWRAEQVGPHQWHVVHYRQRGTDVVRIADTCPDGWVRLWWSLSTAATYAAARNAA